MKVAFTLLCAGLALLGVIMIWVVHVGPDGNSVGGWLFTGIFATCCAGALFAIASVWRGVE